MSRKVKCLIIGSGPAGYMAGVYTARADLKPLLIEGMLQGGQLTTTNEIENFPGFFGGVGGQVVVDKLREQAIYLGVEMLPRTVENVDFRNRPFHIVLDDGEEIITDSVIVATGASARWLHLPGEDEYRGFGVSTCATCDGNFFRNKTTVVIGGGDTALEDAIYLSNLCTKVYIVHRRDAFRGTMALQNIVKNTPNIEILWNNIPMEIVGEKQGFMKKVTALKLQNTITKEEHQISVDGVFEAIGVVPTTELFINQLDLNEQGYIITKPDSTATNVVGVFAAGDVQDPVFRQAVIAAGTGSMAGIECARFLLEN